MDNFPCTFWRSRGVTTCAQKREMIFKFNVYLTTSKKSQTESESSSNHIVIIISSAVCERPVVTKIQNVRGKFLWKGTYRKKKLYEYRLVVWRHYRAILNFFINKITRKPTKRERVCFFTSTIAIFTREWFERNIWRVRG